jgi:hypothetical protein
MKLNKIFAILFAAAMMLPMTSCLKEQDDVFMTPSSQRMQNYLENVRKILQKPSNGWALSYYPGSSSATCYMAVKFGAQQVTAYSQDAPNEAVTSSYKLATDDGAVLSFDTYNSVLHYYATASADHYQARGGDFEFDIISVSAERIVLRGKRSRNLCYLDPLSSDATSFLTKMVEAKNALSIVAFSGEVTGGLVDGFLDGTSNTLSIGRRGAEASEMVSARYMIVPGGIHINEPFTFQGVTFQDFEYEEDPDDATKGTFTGSGITFEKVIPEGYVPYNQFLGNWTFYWYSDSRNFPIELVALEPGVSFKMKGLSTSFEPVLGYNAARGQLTWNAQAVGTSAGVTVWLAAWDLLTNGGSLTWDEAAGLIGIAEDNTVEELVINWKDNGESDLVVDSWLLWGVDGSGNSAGSFSGWNMASGSYQLPYLTKMVKIVE